MNNVIIVGAGGHGKVISDIINACNDKLLGFLDDKYSQSDSENNILGKIEDAAKYINDAKFIVAIGDNTTRERIVKRLKEQKAKFYTAIHPTAVISKSASVGVGTTIMPYAVINAGAKIGEHCIINTSAVVEHDNIIEDFVHLSPRTALGGTVKIGSYSHIGIGATVKNNVSITHNCIIGAGAVVVKNIDEKGTYIGVPARKI